jgi:hypothetical protein
MLYAAYMAKDKTSPEGIRTKLSAVGHWYLAQCNIDPRINTSTNQLHLNLATQLRGISKLFTKAKKMKAPLTPDMARVMISDLITHRRNLDEISRASIAAAMSIAVFGLLRVSEYCSAATKEAKPEVTLLRRDVAFVRGEDGRIEYAILTIKASKTDVFRRSVPKRIYSSGDPVACPVLLLHRYYRLTQHLPDSHPLFVFTNARGQSTYLTRPVFNNQIKLLATRAGFKSALSTHSCRVGGATALAALGYTDVQIGLLGRWTSDCFKIYTRMSQPWVKGAAVAMGRLRSITTQIVQAGLRKVAEMKDSLEIAANGDIILPEPER